MSAYDYYSVRPQFDERDQEIRAERCAEWTSREGPCVGDYVIMPNGELRRFTHDWGGDIQTTWKGEAGSFYFGKGGYCSYSGSLDSAIPKALLHPLDEWKAGAVWFFHHDSARAHNGVHTTIPCRVYSYQPHGWTVERDL
jgi:hypothetical protein